MQDKLDDKLWELQKATNRYLATDPLADWVLFALTRYINSSKATRAFENAFIAYPNDKLTDLIKKCLNKDKSDEGIIRTCKKEFGIKS